MRATSHFIVLVVAIAAGCGSKYTVVPVRGTIQLDGKPLEGATILTQPIGPAENNAPGPGSYGHTDAEGRFTLELQNEPTPGAVPGVCVIMITEKGHSEDPTSDVITREDYRSRIPDEFRDGTYKYTIPEEGTDAMDLDLKSERRRR